MAFNQFNVRVYGILIGTDRKILVTEEFRMGRKIIKFPGGGLEFGEGTLDCIKREFQEELNMDIQVEEHFYTTDFFQPSAFNPKQQVISIYYLVKPSVKNINLPQGMNVEKEGDQTFKWIDIRDLTIGYFTFPIDNKVAGKLIEKF